MKKLFLMLTLLLFAVSMQTAMADDLDDLGDLGEDGGSEELLMEDEDPSTTDKDSEKESTLTVEFGGYLKTLGYWNKEEYSDLLWDTQYAALKFPGGYAIPADQQVEGYNNIGTRMQLKVEGFLGDSARLFSAINVNMNTTSSLHDTSGDSEGRVDLRMVESFIEIYNGSRTWKIGPQIVTWSFLEGMEVPTDRVNARDNSYKSTEYEDSKMASAGVLLTQNIFDSALEVMFIPIANSNVDPQFKEFLYPGPVLEEEKNTSSSKWATRFVSSIGDLDYAISYVDGPDPVADLYLFSAVLPIIYTGKTYNRVQSPGLDLQYNFGSWLAKLSYVNYITEDSAGDDPYIKNNWNKYVIGGEFTVFGNSVNLYAGQQTVENFSEEGANAATNFLLGQLRERTDFVSGHVNANFLTGDALNLVLMAAGYWDEDGEPVQSIVKATFKYKVANGLDVLFSPMYMDMMDNVFTDYQLEAKYSF